MSTRSYKDPEAKFFEDFELGDVMTTRGRTVDIGDITVFAGLTGDHYQLHTDAQFMVGNRFGQRIAHGPLTFSLAVGLVGLNRFVNRMSRWRKGPDAPQLPRVKLHLVLLGLMQASAGWLLLGVSLWMTVPIHLPCRPCIRRSSRILQWALTNGWHAVSSFLPAQPDYFYPGL